MYDPMTSYLYDDGISFPVRPSPAAYGDYGSPLSSIADHSGHIYESGMGGHNGHLHSRGSCMVGRERHCHRPVSAVCAGPYGDPLYPTSLMAFDRETKGKMEKLKWKLISSDPCYAGDARHWHPRQRRRTVQSSLGYSDDQENKLSVFLPSKEIVRSGWTNLSSDAEDDDRSSVSGPETTGFGNFCYLCSTLDEHKKHLVQKPKHLPKPRVKYVAPPPKIKKSEVVESENEDKEKTVFRVLVKTGKHRNAGTSGNVFIQLQGVRCVSKRKQLTRKHSIRFTFGVDTTEIFYVKTADVGSLEAILVEHVCGEPAQSWFLEWIELLNMVTHERVIFTCDNWLSTTHGDKRTKRVLKASSKTDDNSLTDYEVQVYTGSRSMAGTNANVYATFIGRKGTSARLRLKNEEGKGRAFQKGSRDTFRLSMKNLGPLTGLRIEHDNTGTAPGWFLDKVTVLDISTGVRDVFPCDQWLALDEGDGKLSKMLQPLNTSGKGHSEIEYEVQVFTGNQFNAGTDANVFVTLYGAKGTSPRVQLKKGGRNNFEKGGRDSFRVMAADVGSIAKLKIEHDNSGAAPGWFLEKVVVTNVSTKKSLTFPCGQWLAKDEGDGTLCRTLSPLESTQNRSRQTASKENLIKTYDLQVTMAYDLQVTTGNVSNAGTDANIFVTLYGLNGTTTKTQLKNQSRNNFEKGKTDVFAIEAEDVGEISSIRIEHDNSGIGPGWYLEKVILTDRKTRKSYTFPCGRWLATDEDDRMISRKLYRTDDDRDDTPTSRRSSSVSSVAASRRSHDSLRF